MTRWVSLGAFVLLFVPPLIWPWSHDILVMCQLVAGVVAGYSWGSHWSARRQKSVASLFAKTGIVILAISVLTICFPAVHVGETTVVGISAGAIHVHSFLGSGPGVKSAAAQQFSSGPIAPYANKQGIRALGVAGVFRIAVFCLFAMPSIGIRHYYEFTYVVLCIPFGCLSLLCFV